MFRISEISKKEYCPFSFKSDFDLTMFFWLVHLELSTKHRFASPTDNVCSTSFHMGLVQVLHPVLSRKAWSRSTNLVL